MELKDKENKQSKQGKKKIKSELLNQAFSKKGFHGLCYVCQCVRKRHIARVCPKDYVMALSPSEIPYVSLSVKQPALFY